MSCVLSPLTMLKLAGQQEMGLADVPQMVAAPWKSPPMPMRQVISSVKVHAVPMQQAPGQGLGAQPPVGDQVPLQEDWRTMVQGPGAVQQRPGCGQGLGLQEPD